MLIEHNQHIGIYRQAFSKDFCDKIIEHFEASKDFHTSRSEHPMEKKAGRGSVLYQQL